MTWPFQSDSGGANPSPSQINIPELLAQRQRVMNRLATTKPVITRAFDLLKPVTLGGKVYLIGELRLIDLAELQAWIEGQSPHPLANLPSTIELSDPSNRDAIRQAWESAKVWPPRIDSSEAFRLIRSPLGQAFFLHLVLHRSHPDLDPDQYRQIAASMTQEEWGNLRCLAYGIAPLQQIASGLVVDPSPGLGTDWPEAIVRIVKEYRLTFEQVGNLTLSQWRLLNSGGRAVEHGQAFGGMIRRVNQLLKSWQQPKF